EVIAPAAEDLDREHRFPYDIVRQMGELGIFGLPFAEEVGGAGGDFLSYCIAVEEISRGDAGVGITVEAAVSLGAAPIHDFGTKEQKERLLPDLLAGRKLWAFGLTERGAGYKQFLATLLGGRVAIAAVSLGVAQACLDASLSYSRERHAFGKPISAQQAIQFKLADMATEVELSRLITYRAAVAYERRDKSMSRLASMAKLFASETSKRAADQAVQIHGGYGFIEDYPVARYYRDVKVNEIGEGTS